MAASLVNYPEDNQIQMIPSVELADAKYDRYKHYNEWWFKERLKSWQGTRTRYEQKYQFAESVSLQWHNNSNAEPSTIEILNECGQVVYTQDISSVQVTGFEITNQITGVSEMAWSYAFSKTWGSMTGNEGVYYIVIRNHFTTTSDVVWISEPQWVREEWEDTMLIEYSHSENTADVFYVNPYVMRYQIRVEAWLHDLTAKSTNSSYEDERVDTLYLESTPFNTYTFAMKAVPEWMVNKVNRALSKDRVRLNHPYEYWLKEPNADWEKQYDSKRALQGYAIQVKKAKNYFSQQAIMQEPLLVWEALMGDQVAAKRFPYFVSMARLNRTAAPPVLLMTNLTGGVSPFPYSTDCLEVRNTSDEQILLDHANNVTKPFYGQLGYYDIVVEGTGEGNAHMYYYPAPSEINYTGSNSVVLTKHILVTFENGAYNGGQFYDVKGSWIGYAAILQSGTHSSAGYGDGNPTITYLVGGNSINLIGDVARIYHYRQNTSANTITRVDATYDVLTPNISSIAGLAPQELEIFSLTSGQYFTLFNWIFLVPCKPTLIALELAGNGIVATLNLSLFAGQDLTVLEIYDLSDNNLSSFNVDQNLIQFWNGGGGNEVYANSFGEIYIDDQTPAAPPTGASAAAIAGLNADSWITFTD